MDRDKIIKGLECCTTNDINACDNCPYCQKDLDHNCVGMLYNDILALLKEDCHNCKLECLLQKYDELKEKYDALLKEQEAKPLRCKECSYHRDDGWCNEHGREVKESDYCSFGA